VPHVVARTGLYKQRTTDDCYIVSRIGNRKRVIR